MSHYLPPEEDGRPEPARPPQPYAAPPPSGPYLPPPQGGPYAPPPPPQGGPYAPPPPPQSGPYAPAPQGGPYLPLRPKQPYGPPPGGPYPPPPAQPPGHPAPPWGQRPPEPAEGPITETAPARRRLSPRARRTTEIIALAVLVPLLLGLHWYDDRTAVRNSIERPEVVTVVARGKTATLNRVQWTMLGRDVRDGSSATRSASGGARLKLLIAVRPLDAQAAKDLARGRQVFRVTDRDGHIWSAAAEPADDIAPGSVASVRVMATVPSDRLTSVVLEIAQSQTNVAKGPLAVLRFAH